MLRNANHFAEQQYTRQCAALAIAALAVIAGIFIGGCNTMEGAGKDIEAAGDAIQDAAD